MASIEETVVWFDGMPGRTEREVRRALMAGGMIMQTQVQANASGRPGPNAPTGDYRRSWNTRAVPGELAVSVGTNKVQGMRLEHGFTGTDSAGRVYDQPAFPHVAPAIQQREGQILTMLADAARKGTMG